MMLGLGLGIGRLAPRAAAAVVAARARPYRLAVYGDSFGQRAQDILGSPNLLDAGAVDPQTGRWATEGTSRVGGVQWGVAAWVEMLSGGRLAAPYQLNRAIGGFNTGQLSRRAADGGAGPYTLDEFEAFLDGFPAGHPLRPEGVVLHAGTNDGVTTFTALQSYANLRTICARLAGRGLAVALATVLPRGTAAAPAMRLATDRIAVIQDLNDRLAGRAGHAGLAAEPSLGGRVRVVDMAAQFRDATGQAFDVLPALVYDGLHLSADGCRLLAGGYVAALDALLAAPVAPQLPTGPSLVANGLMAGTGGLVTRAGNAATNAGFTMTGVAPDGWTVSTTTEGGATAWNGTSPANVTGAVTVAKGAAPQGEAIVMTVDCNASGTNANTRAIEAWSAVTLPPEPDLPVGALFEGVVAVELSAHQNCRGVSAELRAAEPDGVTRIARSGGPAPNGTANMALDPGVEWAGANRLVLRTPPRARKAGTYGPIRLAVLVTFAGGAQPLRATVRIAQAGVARV